MLTTLERAKGTLGAAPDTVVLTVVGEQTISIEGTLTNTGASNRLIYIKIADVYVVYGNSSNNQLKPGQSYELNMRHQLLAGETIKAWQDGGADIDFFITIGTIPIAT